MLVARTSSSTNIVIETNSNAFYALQRGRKNDFILWAFDLDVLDQQFGGFQVHKQPRSMNLFTDRYKFGAHFVLHDLSNLS